MSEKKPIEVFRAEDLRALVFHAGKERTTLYDILTPPLAQPAARFLNARLAPLFEALDQLQEDTGRYYRGVETGESLAALDAIREKTLQAVLSAWEALRKGEG